MKNLLKHITVILFTFFLFQSLSVYANEIKNENFDNAKIQSETRILLAEDNEKEIYIPKIPKPDTLPGPDSDKVQDDKGARKILIQDILPKLGIGFIGVAGGFAFLFLIISGIRFLTNYGNEELITKAKNQAIWSVVGLLIAIFAYAIVSIIINLPLT